MLKRITNYILDESFKINYSDDKLNIINYLSIMSIETNEITFKYAKGILRVKGNDLVLSKLLENEVLIIGIIKVIELGDK